MYEGLSSQVPYNRDHYYYRRSASSPVTDKIRLRYWTDYWPYVCLWGVVGLVLYVTFIGG